jgi:hypothetical protein
MINFHDGWVNKAKRLDDGNVRNKTKSTKREKGQREKERQTARERRKKTTIGSQDEYDVISQVTIFSFFSFFFSRLIVL